MVSPETHLKIEERLRPKKPVVEELEEVPDLLPIIADEKEEVKEEDLKVEDIIADAEAVKDLALVVNDAEEDKEPVLSGLVLEKAVKKPVA